MFLTLQIGMKLTPLYIHSRKRNENDDLIIYLSRTHNCPSESQNEGAYTVSITYDYEFRVLKSK